MCRGFNNDVANEADQNRSKLPTPSSAHQPHLLSALF